MKRTLLFAFAVLGVAGCGETERRVAVSGRVTYQGKPLDEALVVLMPSRETKSISARGGIRNGYFSIAEKNGPAPGRFRIEIDTIAQLTGNLTPGSVEIPVNYNQDSELFVEIPDRGAFEIILDLK